MTDGPPRMMCSSACRATYMKWVARINADPGTPGPDLLRGTQGASAADTNR